MNGDKHDLDEFASNGVLHCVWETFAEIARQPQAMNSSKSFFLEGPDGVFNTAFKKCLEADLIPPNVKSYNYLPFKHIVLKIYYSALNMGLLLPGRLDQALDWSARSGPFHFTADGVKYFREGFIAIDDPGQLGQVLSELQHRFPIVANGQIELLIEAQRCIRSGCYRAGMVVMGVANEDLCTTLIDSIPVSCQAPDQGSAVHGDWANCNKASLNFSQRWKPAIRIMEVIKKNVRSAGRGQSWWQWWEMVPGSLYTLGEAVRISRNAAAHDTTRKFTKAEVALLLSAMPTQIEMITNITSFLNAPPPGISPIQI